MDGDNETAAYGALRTIRVDGTLRFNPHANTALLVDSIFVEDGGLYAMGTQTDPSDPRLRANRLLSSRHSNLRGS